MRVHARGRRRGSRRRPRLALREGEAQVRCLAFLRAVNVRGQAVSMEYLRTIFEAEGFTRVETFLEGGNIVFDGDAEDPAGLERVIEQMLADALGYEVATFIRTDAEVRNIARHKPFMMATM